MKVIRRPDLEESTIERLWVEVCPPKSRSFLIGTFNRPPTSSNHAVKDFMPIFDSCLRRAMAMDKEVIITGDLNCDFLPKRTTESDCKQLKALLRQENLTQLINQPTRVTQYSKTLLDIIITNYPHNIRECGVLSLRLSDHDMVFCIRKLNWMKAAPETKIFRNYAKYDPAKFCEDLRSVNWVDGMNSSGTANENVICVDKLWLNFKSAFLKVADCHAPLIQKRVRGVDNCPWMTGQIKKDIRQRDFLLKKARKSSHDEHWLAYKSMRNCVTNSVKRAKQTYNRKLIDNHKDDTKAFWRTMKKIIPGNKISGGSKNIIIEGVLCSEASDGQKIANSFNNVFASAAARLKRTLGSVSFEKGGVGRKLNGSVTIYLRVC